MNNGKPEILSIGAQYCPFCMAESWSMILALSEFGNFNSIQYMMSAPNIEGYTNITGFTFVGATYTSQYISFVSVEYESRNQSTLQHMTNSESAIEKQYDSSGQIPFLDIANHYVVISSQYVPGTISSLNWTQIASQLNDPKSSLAQAIDGAANTLTSAICKIDGGSPSSVCSQTFAGLSLQSRNQMQEQNYSDEFLAFDIKD
jgi:Domain of unknown function (DUF929)